MLGDFQHKLASNEHFCKSQKELWLNPGTESEEVLAQARQLGLNVIQTCSIVAVGERPD